MKYSLHFVLWSLLLVENAFAKEIDSKTDLQQEETGADHRSYASSHIPPQSENGQHEEYWPIGRPDVPTIKALNVKCEKNHMKVNVEFDRPFYGMIFSKGHYSDPKCIHLPTGTGHIVANFEVFLGSCGMTSSEQAAYGPNPGASGLFIENTIIIQYDPQVQEIWDQARRLRCTWYDFYEKSVSFRPFNVDMLDAVTANFLGDNIQCWMQIQVGKGPWASEVAGIVKIGQTMTMVLAIKDDENKFDMLVRNCVAHNGKHQPITLVDEYGCITRPNVMSKFHKIKNFGHTATAVSYAYFQAFKFPDSMNVHFQCVIQVCRYECPEPQCDGQNERSDYGSTPKDVYDNERGRIKAAATNKISHYKLPYSSTFPTNALMNRQGEELPSGNELKSIGIPDGGTPRALSLKRRKRQSTSFQFTDIRTQKVIQVVAPGDVAFALPGEDYNSSVVDIYASRIESDINSMCFSTVAFTAGLVFLLLMLAMSSIIAVFFFLKIRSFSSKNHKCSESIITYENPEFFKIPTVASIHVISEC
ncbi:Cuticlin-1-like protein [Dinothrombium tinctorium]|uniref:Cuticlin-1-like protein n=1 Tax=Dinothrombium tinctorium TaxID=1965070 RepID=A0A443R707_9ACAR|nr:Cuticlin-1-like protein [Dinothrombium tinctorium]